MRSLLLILLALTTTAHAQVTRDYGKKIDTIIQKKIKSRRFNGVVEVIHHDARLKDPQILFSRGYGIANHVSNERNTTRTQFLLASVTKTFTATMAMQLYQEGKLDLEREILTYIPEAPASWAGVKVKHLLSHTSGIIDFLNTDSILEPIRFLELTPLQIMARFTPYKLKFDAGSNISYSNSGYLLMGIILERASGVSYETLLTERLIKPLDMSLTTLKKTREFDGHQARSYNSAYKPAREKQLMSPTNLFALGDIASSVQDLAKYANGFFTNTLLTPETQALMLTPNFERYGYGWSIRNVDGHRLAYHGGHVSGFAHQLSRYVDDGLTIIVLDNYQYGTEFNTASKDIADAIAEYTLALKPGSHQAAEDEVLRKHPNPPVTLEQQGQPEIF